MARRTLVRSSLCQVVLLAAIFGGTASADAKTSQPNIVFFFIDDMGWKDWSGGGSDFLETPSIDRIARDSMVFTNGYANGANCGPSRCCLLSGQYTPRTQYYNVGSIHRGKKSRDRLSLNDVPEGQVLADEKISFAEAMGKAGYKSIMLGKWHVGGKGGRITPEVQGFDESLAQTPQQLSKLFKEGGRTDPKQVYGYTKKSMQFAEKCHLFMEEWSLDGGRGKVATNNSVELYNLRDDPGESVNRAQKDVAKRDEMLDALFAWHDEIGAVIPKEPNPNRKKTSKTKK
jgi:hypothetical protein